MEEDIEQMAYAKRNKHKTEDLKSYEKIDSRNTTNSNSNMRVVDSETNKENNTKKDRKNYKVGILFIFPLVGLITMIAGVTMFVNYLQAKNSGNYVTTTATITQIEERYDYLDDSYDYIVHISYEVDNVRYDNIYNTYYYGMYEGKEITIMYLKTDPNVIISTTPMQWIIFLVFGGLFFAFGICVIIINKRKNNN